MAEAISLSTGPDGIATILIDLPGRPVNTMSRQVWTELDSILATLEHGTVKGVIVTSNKPGSFVAGADLVEIAQMSDDELRAHLEMGQRLYRRLENLRVPTVAAINGDALGGGLELALACKMRVASDQPGLQLGLSETRIGMIPGWGGTVRLPRLIGLANALPLMLSGTAIPATEAHKLGLVDQIVPHDQLPAAARERIGAAMVARDARPPEDIIATLDKAKQDQVRKFADHFPAPLRLIEVVRTAYASGADAGFAAEVQGLIDMRNTETGKNLLRVFFMRSNAKKAAISKAGGTPRDVKVAVVVGGGTMGSGIAHALTRSGIPTTIVEATDDLAQAARGRVRKVLDDDVRRGRMTSDAAEKASSLLSLALTPECGANADLVIEAIVEQLPAKVALFRQLDRIARKEAILATNTSSLSVSELASATSDPSRVVGIHFFNPVPRMPLVEVVRASRSSPDAVATAVALAVKLGKSPVVCNDAPGFIVNRVLFPQLHEACRMCEEGFDITAIDNAIKRWGMPMGPFELMDEIGLDVTLFILQSFQKSLGDRLAPPASLTEAVNRNFAGKKVGKGFYLYAREKGVPPQINQEAMAIFKNTLRTIGSVDAVQQRVLNPMAFEAKKLLAEGVVDDAESIDVATVMGLGFANFRGGLARWAGIA